MLHQGSPKPTRGIAALLLAGVLAFAAPAAWARPAAQPVQGGPLLSWAEDLWNWARSLHLPLLGPSGPPLSGECGGTIDSNGGHCQGSSPPVRTKCGGTIDPSGFCH
jgi:hypothetical protein